MSESQLIFPDFRDEQEASKYPFADYATFTSVDNTTTFSRSAIIDASVYLIGGGGAAYIAELSSTGTEITIRVRTTKNTNNVATATISGYLLSLSKELTVELRDVYSRPAGVIVIQTVDFNYLLARPAVHVFHPDALPFVASCFVPAQEPGLRGILINDTEFVTGNILLVGCSGVTIRKIVSNEDDYKLCADAAIRFDIIGNPLFKRLKCEKEGTTPKNVNYIRTINHSPPDEFGHFVITPIEDEFPEDVDPTNPIAIRVYPSNDNSLVIEAVRKRDV
jgi:hypothetical protein